MSVFGPVPYECVSVSSIQGDTHGTVLFVANTCEIIAKPVCKVSDSAREKVLYPTFVGSR